MNLDEHVEKIVDAISGGVFPFVEELAREGERSAVVLGAARLELALEHLLQKLMRPSSGGNDNLFDVDRPLSTFSTKIALAYRLGVIDRRIEHALHMVRKIRNDFAHAISVSSISESPHMNRLNELVQDVSRESLNFSATYKAFEARDLSEPLLKFCSAVTVLIVVLEISAQVNEQLVPKHEVQG